MATIVISKRKTARGEQRYDVRYRLGGRTFPVVRAGTFKTERDAKARRDLVAGEIARGRNPTELLERLVHAETTFVSLETWGERLLASRIDLAENTRKMYGSHFRKIAETFGNRSPTTISAADVAEWVAEQAEERKAGTVAQYLDVFKVLMDYIGIEPNPARDPKVKLPKRVTEEANPPSDEHFLAIVENLLPRWRLFFITIEQGGLRIGEAAALRWGDVDAAGRRLRLPRGDEDEDLALGAVAAVAHGRDRGRLPARGSCARASGVPGARGFGCAAGDDSRVPRREDPALLAA